MSDLPLIDEPTLESLGNYGPEDFLEQMIDLFLATSKETMLSLREASTMGNAAQAALDAHSLRSSAGNLGLDALVQASVALEESVLADSSSLLSRTHDLVAIHEATVEELVKFRDRLREASRIS
jgi:HPt (histidine-containing phosphotransfer) domain-containing protein